MGRLASLCKGYTQESTLHGVRFISGSGGFLRRTLWLLLILVVISGFLYMAVDRYLYLVTYPKAVNLEVSYLNDLRFPSITLCNQNMFRMSPLQRMGLYDAFRDTFTVKEDQHGPDCIDHMVATAPDCMLLDKYWNKNTVVYSEVSFAVCQRMCLNVHKDICSRLEYHRRGRLCIVTQLRPEVVRRPCVIANMYTPNRCGGDTGLFVCDFEGSSCPFIPTGYLPRPLEWNVVAMSSSDIVKQDHTFMSGDGHALQLSKENINFDEPYSVVTERFYNTTNKCLEFYYYISERAGHLRLSALSIDLETSEIFQTNETTAGWYRILVALPSGQNKLVLTGTRMKVEPSGMAVDDILMQSCDMFGARSTQIGIEYTGTTSQSQSRQACRPWTMDLSTSISVPLGGASVVQDYCRNPFLREDGPGCFSGPDGHYESCGLPFSACLPDYFKCSSRGRCIPSTLTCNLQNDCGDWSDENEPCIKTQTMNCTFSDAYNCGFINGGVHAEMGLPWTKVKQIIPVFVKPDGQQATEANIMRLSTFLGDPGDTGWIFSPRYTFVNGCLDFLLLINDRSKDRPYQVEFSVYYQTENIDDLFAKRKLWSYGESYPDIRWRRVEIPLTSGTYRLVFEGVMGSPSFTSVGISDIHFVPGQCRGRADVKGNLSEKPTGTSHIGTSAYYQWDYIWNYELTQSNEPIGTRESGSNKAVVTEKGTNCTFPFTHLGVTYYGCVFGEQDLGPWCKLQNGNVAQCLNVENRPWTDPISNTSAPGYYATWCQFPYTYQGQQYSSCQPDVDTGLYSCGTAPDGSTRGLCLQDCGGRFTAASGIIRSPRYVTHQDGYPSNSRCTYVIEQPINYQITLEIHSFALEDKSSQCLDKLQIYEGHVIGNELLAERCSEQSLWTVISRGNVLSIRFISNSDISRRGFFATYTTQHATGVTEGPSMVLAARSLEVSGYKTTKRAAVLLEDRILDHTHCLLLEAVCFSDGLLNLTTQGHMISQELPGSSAGTVHRISRVLPQGRVTVALETLREAGLTRKIDGFVQFLNVSSGDCANKDLLQDSVTEDISNLKFPSFYDTSLGEDSFDGVQAQEITHYLKANISGKAVLSIVSVMSPSFTVETMSCLYVKYHVAVRELNEIYSRVELTLDVNYDNHSESFKVPLTTAAKKAFSIEGYAHALIRDAGIHQLGISFMSSLASELTIVDLLPVKGGCVTRDFELFVAENESGDVSAPCHIPFIYEDRVYNACISTLDHPTPWCSVHDEFIGSRGSCRYEKTPMFTEGGNANGAPCFLPFIYNGTSYEDCIATEDRDRLWCSTTANYDIERAWGYCVFKTGMIGSTRGGSALGAGCTFPFQHEGRWYNQCIPDASGELFCKMNSTELRVEGDSGDFGYCLSDSNAEESARQSVRYRDYNKTNYLTVGISGQSPRKPLDIDGRCHFPFIHGGKSYHACTYDKDFTNTTSDAFCGLTDNLDRDTGQWAFCAFESDVIEAVDGTIGQGYCEFPFLYRGTYLYYCVKDDRLHEWCGTGEKWGYCKIGPYITANLEDGEPVNPTDENKPQLNETMYTVEGGLCHFPFRHKGLIFERCTDYDSESRRVWCSLTEDFDRDLQWGYCVLHTGMMLTQNNGVTADCEFPFEIDTQVFHQCTTYRRNEGPVAPHCDQEGTCLYDQSGFVQQYLIKAKGNQHETHTEETSNEIDYFDFESEFDGNNLSIVYDYGGHQMSDLVHSCIWEGKECEPFVLKTMATDSGQCVSINGNDVSALFSNKSGSQFGLKLILNTERYQYTTGPEATAGIKVLLHPPDEVPMISSLGFGVAPGVHALAAVTSGVFESLGPPYGDCSEIPLDLYPDQNYTYAKCLRECETKYLNGECECVDEYMPVNGNIKYNVCNTDQYLNCVTEKTYEQGLLSTGCTCPDPCYRALYSTELSYAALSRRSLERLLGREEKVQLSRSLHMAREIEQRVDEILFQECIELFENVSRSSRQFLVVSLDNVMRDIQTVEKSFTAMLALVNADIVLPSREIYSNLIEANRDWFIQISMLERYLDEASWGLTYLVTTGSAMGANERTSQLEYVNRTMRTINRLLETWVPKATKGLFSPWKVDTFWSSDDNKTLCDQHRQDLLENTTLVLTLLDSLTGDAAQVPNDLERIAEMMPHAGAQVKNCLLDFATTIDDLDKWISSIESSIADNLHKFSSSVITLVSADDIRENIENSTATIKDLSKEYGHNQTTLLQVAHILSGELLDKAKYSLKTVLTSLNSNIFTVLRQRLLTVSSDFKVWYAAFFDNLIHLKDYRKAGFAEYATGSKIWRMPIATKLLEQNMSFLYDSHDYTWEGKSDFGEVWNTSGRSVVDDAVNNFMKGLYDQMNELERSLKTAGDSQLSAMDELQAAMDVYLKRLKVNKNFVVENFLLLDVYFAQLRYEKFEQTRKYETLNYLSEIGGYMGLLLGASILTLMEVLDLVVYNSLTRCKKVEEEQNEDEDIQVKNPDNQQNGNLDPKASGGSAMYKV